MDNLTKEQRRKNMRKALWREGIRYRKNYSVLPGKPDIAITRWKVAVFCDSSFWHGRDFETKKPVGTNHEYWDAKIRRNMERDEKVNLTLHAMGWKVLRFWDIEINQHLDRCVFTVKDAILASSPLAHDKNHGYLK